MPSPEIKAAFRKVWCCFLVLMLLWPVPAWAATASQVFEKVKDSVVVVKAYDRQGKPVGLGSGVVLPSGEVATNFHVVKEGVRLTVSRGPQTVPAFRHRADPERDLVILRVSGLEATPVRLGRAAQLKVGEPVYAVGALLGLELSLSEGVVSQVRGGPPPLIQTTAAISPGSSGGGLFNAQGELVGLTTFYLGGAQGLNFAVPVEWVIQLAEKAEEKARKEARPPATPPPGGSFWPDKAAALLEAQDWPGLLAHCRRWTRAEPSNAEAWFNLGSAYWKLGRHREAADAWREAVRLKPDDAEAWYNLGVAYFALGQRAEALKAVRELRRYDPKKADELFDLMMGR